MAEAGVRLYKTEWRPLDRATFCLFFTLPFVELTFA